MIGRLPHLPWDVMTPGQPGEEPLPQNQYVLRVQRDMRYLHQLVRQKTGRSATMIKRYNDRRANLNNYKVGDSVSMKKYQYVPGLNKLQDFWTEPKRIISILPDVNYRVMGHAKDRPQIVHHDRLKPWYVRRPEDSNSSWVNELTRRFAPERPVDAAVQTELAPRAPTGAHEEASRSAENEQPQATIGGDHGDTPEVLAIGQPASHRASPGTTQSPRPRRSPRTRRQPERYGVVLSH